MFSTPLSFRTHALEEPLKLVLAVQAVPVDGMTDGLQFAFSIPIAQRRRRYSEKVCCFADGQIIPKSFVCFRIDPSLSNLSKPCNAKNKIIDSSCAALLTRFRSRICHRWRSWLNSYFSTAVF
jgi:hypothetical protein